MEELIKQAFLHVDKIGPYVQNGHYDLLGPDGEIILPQVWETIIQPDWTVTMLMWPISEPPLPDIAVSPGHVPPPPPMSGNHRRSYSNAADLSSKGSKGTGLKTYKAPPRTRSGNLKRDKKPSGGFFAWATGGRKPKVTKNSQSSSSVRSESPKHSSCASISSSRSFSSRSLDSSASETGNGAAPQSIARTKDDVEAHSWPSDTVYLDPEVLASSSSTLRDIDDSACDAASSDPTHSATHGDKTSLEELPRSTEADLPTPELRNEGHADYCLPLQAHVSDDVSDECSEDGKD